ncbi:M48 family metallopeptidase [Leeia oryzae]|uniref:M48 family metallopeptidase n=1 Tax=Leeia oryzae TaxID=356662 RepID=UPI00036EC11F|nr:M48 family metallopeptidase [Leeia oryzae]
MARQRWGKLALIVLTAATVGLTACRHVQTTNSGNVDVNRKQYMLVSAQETDQMAATAYQQTLQQATGSHTLNTDKRMTERVRGIAQRLIAQVGVFRSDASKWPWEVNVQQSNELNAYCMAGGKIMVYSGLITQLKLTDDELAAVMGHEMAHALREHSRERLSQAYGTSLALSIVGKAAKLDTGSQDLLGKALDVAYILPYSRKHETEADLMGIELSARAGFDPRAAISLWKKMGSAGGSKPPELLSTHPSDKTRMTTLENAIPKVLPLYEAARKTRKG